MISYRTATRHLGKTAQSSNRPIICLASAAALFILPAGEAGATSTFICSLVGEGAHNGTNPTANHQRKLKLFGTDLGFSFRHDGDVMMLFGDTWNEDDFICQSPDLSDDALGVVQLSRDSDPDDCLDIRFPARFKRHLKPLRVFDGPTELNMGAFRTPITGWSDNDSPYGYFTGNPTVVCQPNANPVCPDGLLCEGDIFCVDPGSSLAGLPGGSLAGERLIAASTSAPNPPDFQLGYTFATNKFLNATARVVREFEEEDTESNDYRSSGQPTELLMWGRPSFLSLPPDASADVYLLHHPLDALDGPGTDVAWQPRYFAGLDSNDDPVWTNDQIFATPVLEGEEIIQVLQFSVAWVEPINRFVMLYSGRLPQIPANNMAGIQMRMAEHPWGPWSDPVVVWNPLDDGAYDCPGILYLPLAVGDECPTSDPYRPNFYNMDNFNQCPGETPAPHADIGVEYGVNILDTFTKPGIQLNTATIYWNMSTWNPYRVVLMRTNVSADQIESQ